MLTEVRSIKSRPAAYAPRPPLVSVIVTHRNYSDYLEAALRSLAGQKYENWECVVVDDASDDRHRLAVERIVADLGQPASKIRVLRLEENVGQVPAFFAGFDVTSGAFVCLLDPDDRYAETFLEEAVAAHLNGALYAPIVSTDQQIISGEAMLTASYADLRHYRLPSVDGVTEIPAELPTRLLYIEAQKRGWHWTSTSALMLRRAAVRYLRPSKVLAYKGAADSYLANGAHALGGTLFLTRPLVYRSVHADNAYLTENLFASTQNKRSDRHIREGERSGECIVDVLEAIRANGGEKYLFRSVPDRSGGLLAKWRRSVRKRWMRLVG